MAITVRSRKSKGRRLQVHAARRLREKFGTTDHDFISAPASVGGEDIIMSEIARKLFPFSVECKNQEKLKIWEAIEQAKKNCGEHTPIVVFSRNNAPVYVAIEFEQFLDLVLKGNNGKSE